MVCRINNLAGGRTVQTWCGGCFWERRDDVMIPMGFWGGGPRVEFVVQSPKRGRA